VLATLPAATLEFVMVMALLPLLTPLVPVTLPAATFEFMMALLPLTPLVFATLPAATLVVVVVSMLATPMMLAALPAAALEVVVAPLLLAPLAARRLSLLGRCPHRREFGVGFDVVLVSVEHDLILVRLTQRVVWIIAEFECVMELGHV
jgi:hypothetical protein